MQVMSSESLQVHYLCKKAMKWQMGLSAKMTGSSEVQFKSSDAVTR